MENEKYLITSRDGRKIAVKPTMLNPDEMIEMSKPHKLYRVDEYRELYNEHLTQLPALEILNHQDREVGTWLENVREQWQMEVQNHPDEPFYWINITEEEYRKSNMHIDCRIVLVDREREDEKHFTLKDVMDAYCAGAHDNFKFAGLPSEFRVYANKNCADYIYAKFKIDVL